ncbi:hypothetical protein Q3G72_013987 [Acer saccharum]|nr:hypothetical protein Q3G72_013987 [Acer saccharum]
MPRWCASIIEEALLQIETPLSKMENRHKQPPVYHDHPRPPPISPLHLNRQLWLPLNQSLNRECDINFRFECIPLPCEVKHKCHTHPLTLTYSPKFKASRNSVSYNEVICDICKAGYLIAGHPIFLCAECKSFVHIECTISEDDTAVKVLKYLNPRPEKEQRSSTEDHCGQAELDRGNGNGSERMETLPLELEALEEKHANEAS